MPVSVVIVVLLRGQALLGPAVSRSVRLGWWADIWGRVSPHTINYFTHTNFLLILIRQKTHLPFLSPWVPWYYRDVLIITWLVSHKDSLLISIKQITHFLVISQWVL